MTRFSANEKYTVLLAEGAEQMTEESLTTLEKRLRPYGFLRVHRGELIRIDAVTSLDAHGLVELSDGQRARVSRRSYAAVKAALGSG